MSNLQATNFKPNRSLNYSKKLFITLIKHTTFCYAQLIKKSEDVEIDIPPYSRDYCKKHTKFKFEDYLKKEFVNKYLQEQKKNFGSLAIERIDFQYETEKDYTKDGIKASDKTDIFISNLGLQTHWSKIKREDIYFVFECKILKNTSKNNAYIGDIQKFVEREYKFRFPFEGMIGFVEKSSKPIDEIIADINRRLQNSSDITTTQKLTPFTVKNFDYCRLSKHKKITSPNSIEVYHLFFDYSKVIVE